MENFEAFIGVNFWTALFTLANFLIVLYVGKRFLYGPVLKIIQDRQQEIDSMYTDANSAKEAAVNMQKEYQQKLAAAQQTSEQMVKEAVARAHSREEEILSKANNEAAAILAKASADIAQEKKKAINDAKNEISGLAIAIAGKVVERELKESDQTDLIDRFIEELGEKA